MAKYSYQSGLIRNKWPIVASIVVVISIVGIYYKSRPEPIIPSNISKKTNFDITIPSTPYTIDRSSVSYKASEGILTYTSQSQDGISYIVNEQATPSAFTDSPQIYPALLLKMHEYAEIQTSRGNVALTKPEELNGLQTAVINSNGTLIFIKPSKNIANDQWIKLINSFERL